MVITHLTRILSEKLYRYNFPKLPLFKICPITKLTSLDFNNFWHFPLIWDSYIWHLKTRKKNLFSLLKVTCLFKPMGTEYMLNHQLGMAQIWRHCWWCHDKRIKQSNITCHNHNTTPKWVIVACAKLLLSRNISLTCLAFRQNWFHKYADTSIEYYMLL